jgi:hypothetical protein
MLISARVSDNNDQSELESSEDTPGTGNNDQTLQEPELFYYSVFKKVYYDTESIYANTGENGFDYEAVYAVAIAKAKLHAETVLGIDPPCFFVSAIATVKWARSTKAELMVFTLETGSGVAWTKIVTAIETRHLTGKKDLVVALDF